MARMQAELSPEKWSKRSQDLRLTMGLVFATLSKTKPELVNGMADNADTTGGFRALGEGLPESSHVAAERNPVLRKYRVPDHVCNGCCGLSEEGRLNNDGLPAHLIPRWRELAGFLLKEAAACPIRSSKPPAWRGVAEPRRHQCFILFASGSYQSCSEADLLAQMVCPAWFPERCGHREAMVTCSPRCHGQI
jgi:hypothetical protein